MNFPMSNTHGRRWFIKAVAALPCAAAASTLVPFRAAMAFEPITMAVISTLPSLVGAFTRSDGGMSALLHNIEQKLGIALDELNAIEHGLGDLLNAVGQLPEEFRRVEVALLANDRRASILGAMAVYREIMAPVAKNGIASFTPQQRQRAERHYDQIVDFRADLANNGDYGSSAPIAMLVPVLAAIESSYCHILEIPAETKQEALRHYVEWADKTTEDTATSAMGQLKKAASDHQSAMSELAKLPGVDGMLKMVGTAQPLECVSAESWGKRIERTYYGVGMRRLYDGGTTYSEHEVTFPTGAVSRLHYMGQVDEVTVSGIQQLKVSFSSNFDPSDTRGCKAQDLTRTWGEDADRRTLIMADKRVQGFGDRQKAIDDRITTINTLRTWLFFCSQSLAVTAAMRREAEAEIAV